MSPQTPSPAPSEELLASLRKSVSVRSARQRAVWKRVSTTIAAPEALQAAAQALAPKAALRQRLWRDILGRIEPLPATFWSHLRARLTPSGSVSAALLRQLRLDIVLEPAPVRSRWQWVAVACLVLILSRSIPSLVLPAPSVAQSTATVFPTRGQVSVLIGGLWEPLEGELVLTNGMQLRTGDGEATLTFYDDAVVRLAPNTSVTVTDLTDRPQVPNAGSALLLQQGEIWLLGLTPTQFAAVQISTPQGRVSVNEASVSMRTTDAESVLVTVWDRVATVARRGQAVTLVAGEEVRLNADAFWPVSRFDDQRYGEGWVSSNLDRDAVHQRAIAELQQERRAAQAGILPDSSLYGAKRLAERMDVFMTFSTEERVRKQLAQANTRLSEAAALLAEGQQAEAQTALSEFQTLVLEVGLESDDPVVSEMIHEEVVSLAAGDLAAALPNDPSYVLKQTVEETIAQLPDTVAKPDIDSETVLDALTLVRRQANDGQTQAAEQRLAILKQALISSGEYVQLSDDARSSLTALESYLTPEEAVQPALPSRIGGVAAVPSEGRTAEEVFDVAVQIRNRVLYTYRTHEGREQWLRLEAQRLANDPDKGSILRQLRNMLPTSLHEAANRELDRYGAAVRSQRSSTDPAAVPVEPTL